MSNASAIKSYFRKLNIPVRVRTGVSKHPFICAWIQSENNPRELIYKYDFPMDLRVKALKIVYGADCKFAERGDAGNVNAHSISMHEKEWIELLN